MRQRDRESEREKSEREKERERVRERERGREVDGRSPQTAGVMRPQAPSSLPHSRPVQ